MKSQDKKNSQAKKINPSRTVFRPEGAVYKHPAGTWYVRRDGKWRLMTEEEVQAHLADEEQKK